MNAFQLGIYNQQTSEPPEVAWQFDSGETIEWDNGEPVELED